MKWDHFFWGVRGCWRFGYLGGLVLLASCKGFLQQGIKGAPWQTMASHFQKGARQRFPCSGAQCRVVLPELFLFLQGAQKATGDFALCAGFDQGVSILRSLIEGLLQFGDTSFEAFQDLFRFLPDMGELAVGKIRHIGHENLPVIPQGEESRSC